MKTNASSCRIAQLVGVLVGALLLSACGGGGGGSGATTPAKVNHAPVANAGAAQTVNSETQVTLDGSGSSDSDGDTLTYAWTQTAGPAVSLSDPGAVKPTFTAPNPGGDTTLKFKLTVSDGKATGSDSVSITVHDVTPPTATVAPTTTLDIHGHVTVTFDEPVDPSTLVLGGSLAANSDGGTWNSSHTVLTIGPDAMGAWVSGTYGLDFTVADASGNSASGSENYDIPLVFNNFQSAAVEIGQPDFISSSINQGASVGANTLNRPYGGPRYINGTLWVTDTENSRILGFAGVPTTNDADASSLIGQSTFYQGLYGTTASSLNAPQDFMQYGGRDYLLDTVNNRILIYNATPTSPPGTADAVIGAVNLSSSSSVCGRAGMGIPESMAIVGGRLIVADSRYNRVLIWNSVPTTSGVLPDIVLGQSNFSHCQYNDDNQDNIADRTPSARTMYGPAGVWSDGTRLLVSDTNNHRVLIWNTFPTSSFQPADLVLGQSNFTNNAPNDDDQNGVADATASARTFKSPGGEAWSNGKDLILADWMNNRVLIWNTFPTTSFQPADEVIGQSDFVHDAANDDNQDGTADSTPSDRVLRQPFGVWVLRDRLFVADSMNSRIMIFTSN